MKIPYTLNKGIGLSNGEYITWISDDNEYYRDYLLYLLPLNDQEFSYSCFDFKYKDFVFCVS